LPVEFPDYNAIDSIDSQNAVRLGMRNKLQTKRNIGIDDVAKWDLYTDWRLDPEHGQTRFADLYSDLVVKPRSWLKLESLTRFDLQSGRFRFANDTLTIQPNNRWSWSIGNFYLRDDDPQMPTGLGEGNNIFTSSFFYRLNEDWGMRANQHFDVRDGRMQEQDYTIYRDLRSWTAALTFRVRQNQTGPEDFTIAFTFSLKAHPHLGLGKDSVRPYYLLGQ
jgi:hypothetical protein